MRKKILYLTVNDLYSPRSGGDNRSFHIAKHLSKNNDLNSIFFKRYKHKEFDSSIGNSKALKLPNSEILVPLCPRFYKEVLYRIKRNYFDLIYVSGVMAAIYGLVGKLPANLPLVFDAHNIDHLLYRKIKDWKRYFYSLMIGKSIYQHSDLVMLTSYVDKERLCWDVKDTFILPNGFDNEVFFPERIQENEDYILFFGDMSHEPNLEAVDIICSNIAPRVKDILPEVEIHLAGPNSACLESEFDLGQNIRAVGFIENIADYIRKSQAVIVPLLTGGGTRLKILESLACGQKVISTKKGAEGLPQSLKNLSIVKIREFPNKIKEAIRTEREITDKKREISKYSWTKLVKSLDNRLDDLVRENKES